MKKSIIFIIAALLIISSTLLPCAAAYTSAVELDAEIAYMISLDDEGTVIYDKNSNVRSAPASITKIVTAILSIESCTDFDEVITAPGYCIRLLDGTNSSTAGILVGEQMTVRQYLYCLLLYSANDAANVLADKFGGGSIDSFIEMMNNFVVSLGCENTHFANAHGLDNPDHYTTAQDIAVIFRYCMNNSIFAEITGTFSYEIPATNMYKETRYLKNTNNLLNKRIDDYYFEYCTGGKTGTTDNAGRCLVSCASKDGYNYLCVILNAPFFDCDEDGVNENMAFMNSKKLYNWVFDNIKLRVVANTATYVTEITVRLSSNYDYVSLFPANNVSALVPVGIDAEGVLIEPIAADTKTTIDAPVKKGDVLGKAEIKYAGETIGTVNLVAAFDIDRSFALYLGDIILRTMRTTLFKIIAAVVILIVLPAAIVLLVVVPAKRRRKKDTIRIVKVGEKQQDPKRKK